MKLKKSDQPWMPEDQPQYLLVLRRGQKPPRNREAFLFQAVVLLERLLEAANDGEIENADRMLRDGLPEEMWVWLPVCGLKDKRAAHALLLNPMSEGSRPHEWKVRIEEALELSPALSAEAVEEAQSLSLESFLGQII